MNTSALLEYLDDRLNPIVVKELRQAVKNRAVTVALLVLLAVQMVVTALFLSSRIDEFNHDETARGKVGRDLFGCFQFGLLGCVMVLIPIYSGIRLAAERADGSFELVHISGLKIESIIFGKLFTSLVLGLLVYRCCLPFLTFAYLLGGIDLLVFPLLFWIEGLAGVLSTQFFLFLGALSGPAMVKVVYRIWGMSAALGCFVAVSGLVIVAISDRPSHSSDRTIGMIVTPAIITLYAGVVLFALTATSLRRLPVAPIRHLLADSPALKKEDAA
jgi:hypothetical protein